MPGRATWVIQSNKLRTTQTLPLVEAVRRAGERFVDVCLDDDGIITTPDDFDKNLIPYGSTRLVKIAQAEGWKHLFFDPEKFQVDAWRAHPAMLNADARVMTLSEAKVYYEDERFIRPVADLKSFAGHTMTASALWDWVTRLEVGDCEIDGSELVAVSRPKIIQMEWRYFVVGGRVVTGSSYRFKGRMQSKRELDADVLAEAQALADLWLPHPCCCMDVALWKDEPKVVEFNCLNASGFYDNDLDALVHAVSEYAHA